MLARIDGLGDSAIRDGDRRQSWLDTITAALGPDHPGTLATAATRVSHAPQTRANNLPHRARTVFQPDAP